ncbi:MAG: thioredoxin domain-containing protein [Acidobacteria bacterium]|nr:thioredoxin domain-containing protein [Acidobacteriota bacterium]MBI3472301.1 thioredoxin domain-containing protein [Candidatus Solibacter usitatus]
MRAAALLLLGMPAFSQGPLIEGKPDSAVRVLIYEDLQCSDCAAFRRMMDDALLPRYSAKVAFVHRDFPLAKHAWARKAAIAARHFHETNPELGVAFRRHILASIKQTTEANFELGLAAFASGRGADPKRALAALEEKRLADLVEKDFQDGVARGVAKTPTVFVAGKPFVETFTVDEISKAIDQALADPH